MAKDRMSRTCPADVPHMSRILYGAGHLRGKYGRSMGHPLIWIRLSTWLTALRCCFR